MAESKSVDVITKKTEQLRLNRHHDTEGQIRDEERLETTTSSTATTNTQIKKLVLVSEKSKKMNTIKKIEEPSKVREMY